MLKTKYITSIYSQLSRLPLLLASFTLVLIPTGVGATPAPTALTVSGDSATPTLSWEPATPEASGLTWVRETGDDFAEWSARWNHSTAVFNDKLWVIGGGVIGGDCHGSGSNLCRDVWSSSDGVTWNEGTTSANWSARREHSTAVFDNKLWVIGGTDGGDCTGAFNRCNDVWYSEDGVIWSEAVTNAQWSPRAAHTTAVFDDKLWVIGGTDGSGNCSGSGFSSCHDVWYSEDGVTWTEATNSAGWSARSGHETTVFDNKLWVIGGTQEPTGCNGSGSNRCNDVWYSEDGVIWSEAVANAQWSPRLYHTATVFEDKLWVKGGLSVGGDCNGSGSDICHDVWHSEDGVTWTEATNSAGWSARYSHKTAVFADKLWVLGGAGLDCAPEGVIFCNDTWSTPDHISHYLVCWDRTVGECGGSVKVDTTGNSVAASTPSLLSRLSTALKATLLPSAQAQSSFLSYTFPEPLESGTWYFQLAVVTDSEVTVFSDPVSYDIAEDISPLPAMPDAGVSGMLPFGLFIAFGFAAILSFRTLFATKV